MKIDAFLIGTPRTMTTRLVELMSAHPELGTSNPKESKYFSISYRHPEYLHRQYFHNDIFGKKPNILVYSNPIDCNMDYVRDRIYKHNPEAKIILGVREPISRAISHFGIHRFKLPMGRVCENIWDEFDRNVNNLALNKFLSEGDFIPYCNEFGSCYIPQYLECSLYHNIWKKWQMFPSVYIYEFENLKKNFNDEYNKILHYIGVEPANVAHSPKESNSLRSYGCEWNMNQMVEEFINRYPQIADLFYQEGILLQENSGVNVIKNWWYSI